MTLTEQFSFIQTAAAGLDNPLFPMVVNKTDVFCNSDAQAPAIAEFAVASVLNRWHRFDERRNYQADHLWQDNQFKQILGSHWLIIGYGNIGQSAARQLKGFGAEVTGVRRNPEACEIADRVVSPSEISNFLPQVDVVLLSCALNDATRGLADADFFRVMKSDAVIVNIGRGELLDEDALIEALDKGELDYAVLDVFREEPLPRESPLWDHEQIQVTPHASHRGTATLHRFDELFMSNVQCFLAGEAVRNQVSPDFFL